MLLILIPPLPPKPLIHLPLLLLLFPFLSPLVYRREPLRPRRVLLLLRRVLHHARVHRLLLLPAEQSRRESARGGAGGEVYGDFVSYDGTHFDGDDEVRLTSHFIGAFLPHTLVVQLSHLSFLAGGER